MDPLGFAFETYDAIGRYRTEENGKRVDPSGEVVATTDLDGRFVGVAELGRKMAASTQAQACVVRQWFRYALARFEQDADGCSMKALYDAFRAAGPGLGALPVATVQSDAFLYRRPLAPEVSP
jgi:hypothetical protein